MSTDPTATAALTTIDAPVELDLPVTPDPNYYVELEAA